VKLFSTIRKIIYPVLLVHMVFLKTTTSWGQELKSGFEVDGNVLANTMGLDSNDWFANPLMGKNGVGVIDGSGATELYNFFNNTADADRFSTIFQKRGTLSYLDTVANVNSFLDAVFVRDYYSGSGYVDSTAFVIASKNGEPPSDWHPGAGKVLGKNDIIDVYGYAQREGFSIEDSLYVFCALILNTTSGERYVDFEFFQEEVVYNDEVGAFSIGGAMEEGHVAFIFDETGKMTQYGDLILAVSISTSGLDGFDIRIWMEQDQYEAFKSNPPANLPFSIPADGDIEGAGVRSKYGYGTIRPKGGGQYNVLAFTNSADQPGPPWGSIADNGDYSTDYLQYQYFELGVNLTHAGLDPAEDDRFTSDPCANTFNKYMVKSRASNSFSAQLKDFVGPIDFGSPSDPMVIADAPKTVLGCTDESGIPITASFDNPDSKTSDYYFLWFKDQDTLHASSGYDSTVIYATAPGWYKVQIRAQDYCSSFVSADSIQIFEIKEIPPPPVIPEVAICPEKTGWYLNANNPGAGLSIVWYDAMTGGNVLDTSLIFVPPLLNTDYYAETLNLITGCRSVSRTAARLTVRTGPTITVGEVGNTCVGQKDGSITINTTGSGLVYDWSHGASTEDLTGLAEGQYFLKITDENGCTDTALVEVPANPEINLSPTVTDVLCNAGTTGSINLGASGGTGTLSYSWSPNTSDNSEIVSNLSAGTYSVTVTDAEGCQIIRDIKVGEPNSALSGTAVASDVSCNGGSNGAVEVFPTGGTPGYTYTWSDGSITNKDRVGLSQGMVTVTITDANNCTHDITATVDEPTLLSAVLSPDSVSCYGGADGSISSTVSGGTEPYAYLWNNGKTTTGLSNLSAGSDTLTLTDANGCKVTKDTTVGQPASALTIALASGSTPDSVSCYGGADGAIDLSVSGGTPAYSYNWSNGSSAEDLSGLSAGGYSVEVTDAKLCTAVKSFVVSQPAPLLLSATVQDAACPATADGSIDLTVYGGQAPYTFSWSATEGSNNSLSGGDTVEDPSSLLPDTYNVTVTDANGCTAMLSAVVGHISPVPTKPSGISKN
jgi:hypothetical protein